MLRTNEVGVDNNELTTVCFVTIVHTNATKDNQN